jgi:hypothetical protein
MQTLTEKVFKLAPPGGLFDETVVENIFPGLSGGARNLLVYRAVSAGEVLRLKRGLYCLAEPYRKNTCHPFVIAAALHSPSHVSLESALRYHGLIPEAVHEVSSVTIARSRRFMTPLGNFSFQRVPSLEPRAGVKAVQIAPGAWVFLAGALRAIADLVYLRREVDWEGDGILFLTESMRIEREDLSDISWKEYRDVRAGIQNKRTQSYLDGLRRELGK